MKIIFVFVSPYDTDNEEFGQHLTKHGDGVKDIAFDVEDLDAIVKVAKERGADVVRDIWEESDEHGTARFATVKTVKLNIFIRTNEVNIFFSTVTQLTHWLTEKATKDCSCRASSRITTRTMQF